MIRTLVLLAFVLAALGAADDPFADGKLEIRHEGGTRELVFSARNVSGKDVRSVIIAYVLRDRFGNVVESDLVRCVAPDGAIVVPKDFAGVIWRMPIVEDNVVGGGFGPQEVVFADGTTWSAPTRREDGKP